MMHRNKLITRLWSVALYIAIFIAIMLPIYTPSSTKLIHKGTDHDVFVPFWDHYFLFTAITMLLLATIKLMDICQWIVSLIKRKAKKKGRFDIYTDLYFDMVEVKKEVDNVVNEAVSKMHPEVHEDFIKNEVPFHREMLSKNIFVMKLLNKYDIKES